MAKEFDVYICWASDVDDEYEFLYFKNGSKIRHFHQRDYYRTNTRAATDFGDELKSEKQKQQQTTNNNMIVSKYEIVADRPMISINF